MDPNNVSTVVYQINETLKEDLEKNGYEVVDFGTYRKRI